MWTVWSVEVRVLSGALGKPRNCGAFRYLGAAAAGVPRNYMASRVDTEAVKAHAERQANAAAAGRTYQEQLAFEASSGIAPRVASRRQQRPPAAAAAAAAAPPPVAEDADDTETIIAGLVGAESGGLTPLAFAAREGDIDSARLLIDAGANVNQTTNYGWTPLLIATNNRHYKLASYLVERGANVNLADRAGTTPLTLAKARGYAEMVRILEAAGAK